MIALVYNDISWLPQHTNFPMDNKNTADHAFVRELNLSSVLRLIYSEAPLSRAQLATRTGLNKSTISSLVEDLLDRKLIHETGINYVGTGRPATQLEINSNVGAVVGVELGVDFVAAVLGDFRGKILGRKQINADPAASQDKTFSQAQTLIDEMIVESHNIGLPVLGLSFSIPGTVDLDKGVLIFAPNLQWHNVPFRKLFSGSTGLKVFIENDANAAAIAEHLFGVAQHLKDFIFVFAGVGLGGGLFLNGQLYRGKGGYAGEIGHTSIMAEPLQKPCHCGNLGCWETYANQLSVVERIEFRMKTKRSDLISTLMKEQDTPLSISIILQAAQAGDPDALECLAEAGVAMGNGIAGLVNIFNPEKIILGGPFSMAGDYLLPSIRQSVDKHAMHEIVIQTEINISAFGPDASLIGAVAVVVDDILANPTHVEKEVMFNRILDPLSA
jgi:glucokinase-like ROK family protein